MRSWPKSTRITLCALVLLCIVLILAACGPSAPSQGYVRDKKFVAAHSEYAGQQCVSYGKNGCSVSIPRYEHYDDAWYLYLEDCKVVDSKTKCDRGWHQVDETDFHHYDINQHYPDPR